MSKKRIGLVVLLCIEIMIFTACSSDKKLEAVKNNSEIKKTPSTTPVRLKNYYAMNIVYPDKHILMDLKRGKPSKEVDCVKIATGAKILEKAEFVNSFLLMQHGKLVEEQYFGVNEQKDAQNIHSASKSIISALVGLAIQEGKIKSVDDSISTYLPAEYFKGENESRKAIKIKHLLNMTSGLFWEENVTEVNIAKRTDWVKAILDQKLIHKPGEVFNYSTGNVQIMAEILTRACGTDLKTFGNKVLFSKLGITVDFWDQDPQGIYSGGCNFFITPYEMAKFGQLYLNKGVWNGEQVLPKEWINESFKERVLVSNEARKVEYGYNWWIEDIKGHTIYNALGYAGQCIHIVPDLDLVMVTTANTNKEKAVEDGGYTSFTVLDKYIIPAFEKGK